MDVKVLLSSGEVDEWGDVAETAHMDGQVVILSAIEGDEVPGDIKTMVIETEIPGQMTTGRLMVPEPVVKSETYRVMALYAPGMWMRVEFE